MIQSLQDSGRYTLSPSFLEKVHCCIFFFSRTISKEEENRNRDDSYFFDSLLSNTFLLDALQGPPFLDLELKPIKGALVCIM